MNRNLLIVGAGIYAVVASEIAVEMGCFDKLDFIDDEREITPNGISVIGKFKDIEELVCKYNNVIVAIEEPEIRLSLIQKIKEETPCRMVTLVSPQAYISPSAQIMEGCIIEPKAVISTGCVIARGCIISAGAVVNHTSMCADGVHVDCNATVASSTMVPAGMKIKCGTVYDRKTIEVNNLFFDAEAWAKKLHEIQQAHTPTPINGKTYNFDDVM